MSQLFSSLLHSLLAACALIVAGTVHAHDGGGDDHARTAHRPAGSKVLDTSPGNEVSFAKVTRASPAAALDLQSVSVASADPCERGEFKFGRGCCAVSCHSAVEGSGSVIIIMAYRPLSPNPPMSTPSLHGTVVGPSDHPPRSA